MGRKSAVVIRSALLLLGTLAAGAAAPAARETPPTAAPTGLEARVTEHLRDFATLDASRPVRGDLILFVGSSIFERWENLATQMAPLPVLNRAIGGTTMHEQLAHLDQLVLRYRPAMIVLYCGSNDVNAGDSAATIAANVRTFFERVAVTLPATRIVYASIIRAPQKRAQWSVVDEANARIRGYIGVHANRVSFVDLNPAVFDAQGRPRMDLYLDDQLHYKPPAYEAFTTLLKPALQSLWEATPHSRPQG